MDEVFDIDVPEPAAGPPPGPLELDDLSELPQPGELAQPKRQLTLEEVAKEWRKGNRVEHQYHRDEVKAEIVRQIQERISRK